MGEQPRGNRTGEMIPRTRRTQAELSELELPLGRELLARFGQVILSIQRSGLSRNAKAVLGAVCGLVDWGSWRGQFPTWWVAQRSGVSDDTVARALPELIDWGLLTREEPPRSSPIWQVLPSPILQLEPLCFHSRMAALSRTEAATPETRRESSNRSLQSPAHQLRKTVRSLHRAETEPQHAGSTPRHSDAGRCQAEDELPLAPTRTHHRASEPHYAEPESPSADGEAQAARISGQSAVYVTQRAQPGYDRADMLVTQFADTRAQGAAASTHHAGHLPLKEERHQRSPFPASSPIAGLLEGSGINRSIAAPPRLVAPSVPATPSRSDEPASLPANANASSLTGPDQKPASLSERSPDLERFLQILLRWSGPEAPNGFAWRIQPDADLRWYTRDLVANDLTQDLDMLEVLAGWDEFLEMVVRGQKDCRFPTNFKNSLRNQVLMW